MRATDDRAVHEAAWREQEGNGYEQPDQAVVAARLHGSGGGKCSCATLSLYDFFKDVQKNLRQQGTRNV